MVELWRVDPSDGKKYDWFEYLEHYQGRFKQSAIEAYWYKTCTPIFGNVAQERRIDPADGSAYTFEEMCMFYAGRYRKDDMRAYWDKECTPAPRDERAEKKLDPADMEEHTFKEISAFYRGQGWTKREIQTYWDTDCAFVTISPLLLPATAAYSPREPAAAKSRAKRLDVSKSPLLLPSAAEPTEVIPWSLPRGNQPSKTKVRGNQSWMHRQGQGGELGAAVR